MILVLGRVRSIGRMNYIFHHGIKGQKWGVRRYQNLDGTRTELGKRRYRTETVFISGSSKTQTEDSGYFRKGLPKPITDEIDDYINKRHKIVVGDAPGIDRQVQDYLNEKNYNRVTVFGPGTNVRYLANKNWKTKPIDAPEFEVGSSEWLAKKDIAMEKLATKGLAVVLDEGAKATRKNIERLIEHNKDVKVYELDKRSSNYDRWL